MIPLTLNECSDESTPGTTPTTSHKAHSETLAARIEISNTLHTPNPAKIRQLLPAFANPFYVAVVAFRHFHICSLHVCSRPP